MTRRSRVTTRLYRTEDGKVVNEYVVDGVGYGSLADVQAALEGR